DIKPQIAALRDLHSAVDLGDRIQSLILFSTAYALWKRLDDEIDGLPSEEKPANATYLLEKLALFISYFHYAVMPSEGTSHMPPSDWLRSAGDNLMKVEIS